MWKLYEKGREKKRLCVFVLLIGKFIWVGCSKLFLVCSVFDLVKCVLLYCWLKWLSVGVIFEDISSVSFDFFVRIWNVKKYVSGGFKVKEWIENMFFMKWEDCDDDDDECESD